MILWLIIGLVLLVNLGEIWIIYGAPMEFLKLTFINKELIYITTGDVFTLSYRCLESYS